MVLNFFLNMFLGQCQAYNAFHNLLAIVTLIVVFTFKRQQWKLLTNWIRNNTCLTVVVQEITYWINEWILFFPSCFNICWFFFFLIFTYFLFGCAASQLRHAGSSSLTGSRTLAPALGVWSLNLWTTREVPTFAVLK